MSQSHLFLPALDQEKANFQWPDARARWVDANRKVMLAVAAGITVDRKSQTQDISSIPDIWARPLLCREALSEPAHPKHEQVTQEWRGLLSLLALHKVRGFGLKLVAMEFGAENAHSFLNSLHRLSPRGVQLQRDVRYEWNHLLLIQLGDLPLGAFSPATLVFTGADYHRALKERPDFDLKDAQGRLCPPSDPADRLKVGEWLQALIDKVGPLLWKDQENPDQKWVDEILGSLRQWIDEIRTELRVPEGMPVDAPEVEIDSSPVSIAGRPQWPQQYPLYQALLTPLREAEVSGVRLSEYALAPERDRKSAGEVVLISEDLLKENRRIWRTTTLTVLGGDAAKALASYFEAPSGNAIGSRSAFGEAGIWIRPERYFLVDTVLAATKDGFLDDGIGAVNSSTKFLLPFTRAILDFFSPKSIINALKPEWSSPHQDGSIEFSFTLPLHGNRFIRVKRSYRRQNPQPGEGLIREVTVPLVTVYPLYIDERWRQHYLFHTDAAELRVEPLLGAKDVTVTHRQQGSERPIRIISLRGRGAYPEAIEFSTVRSDAASPAGIALLPLATVPTGLAESWKIGIDFGTSNTNVYYFVDGESEVRPFKFEFKAYQLRVTAAKDEERLDQQRAYFISDKDVTLPIPTVVSIFNPARTQELYLDYSISVPSGYALKSWEHANIKWDVDTERKAKFFLEDLMFVVFVKIAVSQVKEASFLFSYPEAFPRFFTDIFKNECSQVFQKLVHTEGSRVLDPWSDADNTGIVINDPDFRVEGLAGGEYFASEHTITVSTQRASIDTQAVCLDIGGGTTDISIWYDQQIRNDASVMLAGRQISEVFRASSQLCQRLLPPTACTTLEQFRQAPDKFSAALNLILRDPEVEPLIGPNLLKHATDRSVKWLRKMLALEFGAIVFYTGKLIAATDRLEGGKGILKAVDRKGINLYWGGNAAKLIFWLDYGMKGIERNGSARSLFGAILFNSLCDAFEEMGYQPTIQDDEFLEQIPSPRHKSEVSAGLVVMGDRAKTSGAANQPRVGLRVSQSDPKAAHTSRPKATVISGESVTLSEDQELKSTDALRDEELFQNGRTTFSETSLKSLEAFLVLFNRFCVDTGIFPDQDVIQLDKIQKRHIENSIESWFKQMAKEPDDKRKLQPVFIMEVMHLFKLLQDGMGK